MSSENLKKQEDLSRKTLFEHATEMLKLNW